MQVPAKIRLKFVCRPLNFKYVQSFDRSIRVSDLISAVENDLSCVTGRNTRIVQITTRDHYALLRHSEIMDVLVDEDVLTVYVVNEDAKDDDFQSKCVSFTKKHEKKMAESRNNASTGTLGKKIMDLQEGLKKKETEEGQGLGVGAANGKDGKESGEQKPKIEATKERSKTDPLDRNKEEQKTSGESQKEKFGASDLKKDGMQGLQSGKGGDVKTRDSKEKHRRHNEHRVDENVVSKAGFERKILDKPEKKRNVVGGELEGEKMIPLKKKIVSREDEDDDSIFK
eukprot:jgi/Antlo1/2067/248